MSDREWFAAQTPEYQAALTKAAEQMAKEGWTTDTYALGALIHTARAYSSPQHQRRESDV
jgi:TRAP-type C4-dicarboxylate transport system substrate-binding protein